MTVLFLFGKGEERLPKPERRSSSSAPRRAVTGNKTAYEKQKGHYIGCRNAKEDPKLVWAANVLKMHAMQETQVQSLRQEDALEKGMAIHSSILA